MEADQVRAQQSFNEFALPWTDSEDFRIGPWNVPENGDACVRTDLFNHFGNQCEVVILRQKNWRVHVRHLLQNGVGEALVDALVLQPVFRTENGARVGDVAERPKAFVRKSIVVAFVFFIREPDAAQGIAGAIRGHTEVVVGIHNFAVGAAGAIGDPCAVARQQNRFESGDHTARGHEHFDHLVAIVHMHVWLAVRDDEEGLVLKPVAQADPQTFSGPQRGIRIAQACFYFGRRSRGMQVPGEVRDLMVQLLHDFALQQRRRRIGLPCSQRAHPFCCTSERLGECPAHKHQRKEADQQGLYQRIQKSIAQRMRDLQIDVLGFVNQQQCSRDLVVAMQRHSVRMDRNRIAHLWRGGLLRA